MNVQDGHIMGEITIDFEVRLLKMKKDMDI